MNIDIDIDIEIDIDIDIDNINTDASTVNSVHACFLINKKLLKWVGFGE